MTPSSPPRRAFAAPARPWAFVRLLGATLILAAITTQLVLTVQNTLAATTPYGSHLPTVIANFFSYFTILSNVSAVVALAVSAVWLLRAAADDRAEPRGIAVLLACVSTYMIVTGIVYNILLRNISQVGISAPWVNEVLHVVGPLILLADVILAPRRRRLGWGALAPIAAFPILWAGYTLIRANFITGPATGNPWWYPYPFLDPHQDGGYLTVALYIVGIAVAILAVGAGVIWAARRRGAVDAPSPDPWPEPVAV